jgi:hypothetical protein
MNTAVAASGRKSAGPSTAIFNKWRRAKKETWSNIDWPNLNTILIRFDWDRWEGTSVGRVARRSADWLLAHLRKNEGLTWKNDYRNAAIMILLYFGMRVREGQVMVFPEPVRVSNARFIQRLLYYISISMLLGVPAVAELFNPEEQKEIKAMALFCGVYYGAYFLQTPFASRAARLDLELVGDLRGFRMYDDEMATAALKVMDRHTDYLSPRLLPFCLADPKLDPEVRRQVAESLAALLDEWPDEFEIDDTEKPGPRFASGNTFFIGGPPDLAEFTSPNSFLMFRILGQGPEDLAWLRQPVEEWPEDEHYVKFEEYVNTKEVTNDSAERAIGNLKIQSKHFRTEDTLQAGIVVDQEVKRKYPKGKVGGKTRFHKRKAELKKVTPSEMLDDHFDSDSDDSDAGAEIPDIFDF